MHVFDFYHSRWFISFSLLMLALTCFALLNPGFLPAESPGAAVLFAVLFILVLSGSLLLRFFKTLPASAGFLIAGFSTWITPPILKAAALASGFLLLLAVVSAGSEQHEAETGPVSLEWLGSLLLWLIISTKVSREGSILLAGIGLRYLFGLVFRVIPIRISVAPVIRFLRVSSWLPAMIVILGKSAVENASYLLWQGLALLFVFSRLLVMLDEGRLRLAKLKAIIPPGERLGLWKSYAIYYLVPGRALLMRRFYSTMVPKGGMAWDVGAHLGNRSRIWLDLGAKVIAFEPQPSCAALLNNWFGSNPNFVLKECAAGPESGEIRLNLSSRHPTLASVSRDWVERMSANELFNGIEWDKAVSVPATRLADQVLEHGLPDFIKIDVEGFESQVIEGMEQAPACLSFELLPVDRENALSCIELLSGLGDWNWNITVKESFKFVWAAPVSRNVLSERIRSLSDSDPSGDIYAYQISRK